MFSEFVYAIQNYRDAFIWRGCASQRPTGGVPRLDSLEDEHFEGAQNALEGHVCVRARGCKRDATMSHLERQHRREPTLDASKRTCAFLYDKATPSITIEGADQR